MKVYQCLQYSEEWWALRRGKPTASGFDKILSAVKMKPSAQQDDYIAELIADAVQPSIPFFTTSGQGRPMTREMQDGLDREHEARCAYALATNRDVQQVGFCASDCGRYGCSPDGLVGTEGVLELKCPTLATQAKYLLKGILPNEYKAQVHGQLIVTRRAWVDFFSYAPGLRPLLIRVVPDDFTKRLEEELDRFLEKYKDAAVMLAAINADEHGEVTEAF